MNTRHILQVFRKDGLEILRDRRTLFVNIILPLLLYPVIMLFGLQVYQLTQLERRPPPRVVLVDAAPEFTRLLPVASSATTPSSGPAIAVIGVSVAEAQALRQAAATLESTKADNPAADDDRRRAARTRAEASTLAVLRRLQADAAVVALPPQQGVLHLVVLSDDASRHTEEATAALEEAIAHYREDEIQRRLAAAHLPTTTAHPVVSQVFGVAPVVEAIRTHLSSLLPMLLVLLAASGAFFPALDLISGERERGTLESLLSLPVRRRDIFLGKLLVACTAAAASVALNITSFGVTTLVMGHEVAGNHHGDLTGLFSVSLGALLLCFVVLLPLTVTLAAAALAITGLAASAKEAQNYLSPFFLVVMLLAGVCIIPGTQPSFVLDLVPVVGPVLALKESLQQDALAWVHLVVTTAASLALGWVVVGWSTRLLEDERFRYPGLVRAGWGRFRRWGTPPPTPGGMEALGVYALALGLFLSLSGLLIDTPTLVQVSVPLLGFAAIAVAHCWLGGYDPARTLGARLPQPRAAVGAVLLIPCAVLVSIGIGVIQAQCLPEGTHAGEAKIEELLRTLLHDHHLATVVLLLAVLPGLCEELFFRGPLLAGLARGVGVPGGIILSGFLFAAAHGSPDRFLPQWALGVVLGVLVVRTGSILPGMLVHAGNNAAVLLIDQRGWAWARALHLQGVPAWADRHGGTALALLALACLAALAAMIGLLRWVGRPGLAAPALPPGLTRPGPGRS